MKKIGILLCAMLLVGCQTEVLEEEVRVGLVEFGRYEIRDGRTQLASITQRIPCELDTIFGIVFRVEAGERSAGVVPVDIRWRHPKLDVPSRGLSGTESPPGIPQLEIPKPGAAAMGRVLWTLEHPRELVAGRYTFEMRLPTSGQALLLQAFDVEDCPGD